MLLGKSCSTKYHIKHGRLKLGTLHEYRTIENEELQDPHEGMLTFNLHFHERVLIPNFWWNTISGGGVVFGDGERLKFPGRTITHVEHCNIGKLTQTQVEILESTATFSRESVNTFIFCMSMIRKTSDCHGIFKGCDDYWYVREQNTHDFALIIGKALLAHIRKKHSEGLYILPKETNMERLDIGIGWGKINYANREVDIYNNGLLTLEEFAKRVENMTFTKPDSYARENEFRFNFTPMVDRVQIEPIVTSTILDIPQLLNYVFWL